MSSPQDKGYHLHNQRTPYSKLPLYPSMREDFIPLGFSSPIGGKSNYSNYKQQRNSPQKNRNSQRKNRSNNSRTPECCKKHFDISSDNIRQYIHPSMLEDPWKELLVNVNTDAICEESTSKNVTKVEHSEKRDDVPPGQ